MKTAKISKEQKLEMEKAKQEEKEKVFREKLPFLALNLIARAQALNVDFKIIDDTQDLKIYLATEQFKNIYYCGTLGYYVTSNYKDALMFSYNEDNEDQFMSLVYNLDYIEIIIKEEKLKAEKVQKAKDKLKTILTEEERKLLNINL